MFSFIGLGFLILAGYFVKLTHDNPSKSSYARVLIVALCAVLFDPLVSTLLNTEASSGAISMANSLLGIYFIIWSIVKIVKHKNV